MCLDRSITPVIGSRRRRLWELPHKHHCAVVGVCFDVKELRGLVTRLVKVPGLISDFELHRCTVQACEARGKVSELLQKTLEKRYALTIVRLRGSDGEALRAAWQAGMASGDVGPTLWAVLTHPHCDETLADTVYGELHMLQHQVGSARRRDQSEYQALQREHAILVRELAAVQVRATQEREQRLADMRALRAEAEQLQAESIGWQEQLALSRQTLESLRESLPDLADRERLLKRVHSAEAQCHALRAHIQAQEGLADQWQRKYLALRQTQEAVVPASCAEANRCAGAADCDLAGKRVLCIGGRPGVIEFYRQLVEGQGGSFRHHDGGLEENTAQIEPSIAAADAVICQAGCINHNAYWRVKDFCKRTGKPCVFLKSAGISSFQRGLEQLAQTV